MAYATLDGTAVAGEDYTRTSGTLTFQPGTIANSDPLQKVWLSRFGRTVASHVTEAVSDRLANPLSGAQVTVGGQTVDLAETQDEAFLGRTLTSIAQLLGASAGCPTGPCACPEAIAVSHP